MNTVDKETWTGPWGVFDPKTKTWLGNEGAPLVYTDTEVGPNKVKVTGRTLAKMAVAVVNERFGWTYRLRAMPYTEKADRLFDVITPHRSAEEAISRILSRAGPKSPNV